MQNTIILSLLFGLLASLNILFGGYLAMRMKKYFNLLLGVSGGLMLGTAIFAVLPEIIEILHSDESMTIYSMLSIMLGLSLFHTLSKVLPLHEHGHHDGHSHTHIAHSVRLGTYGAMVMIVHSFIDGLGIGIGFSLSLGTGLLIAIAVMSHNISDGVNTASTLIKNGISGIKFKVILGLNIIAPLLGVLTSFMLEIDEKAILLYLSFFFGSILYLAISDILPEAHSISKDRKPIIATILSILFILTITLLFPHSH
jgi:zinc transporter, ZIP family